MNIDFDFMKSTYECVKEASCGDCDVHTDQVVMGKSRTVANLLFFCPSPEKKVAKKSGLSRAQKGKAKK